MANAAKNKAKSQAPKTKGQAPAGGSTGSSKDGLKKWRLPALLLAGVLVLTFFIYQPALNYGFTNWDDNRYVTENTFIGHPENIQKMLTTPVAANFHPLTMYSLAYDYKATEGLPEQERGHRFHAVNIVFHLLNILLIFYFTYLLSNKRMWMSLACALLFAIHPMHVESVAWVAERKDVLYTFFFFISLISYLLFSERKNYGWWVVSLLAFILSLASKPAAVILPLVLLCIDYFRSRKFSAATITEKVPFFILSVVAGLLTIKAQQAGGALTNKAIYTIADRILSPCYAVMMYWIKLFFPFHLASIYLFPDVMGFEFYIAPVVVLVVTGAILYFGKRNKIMLFGLLFFFANMALILQFVNVGQAIIAERYTYVSYLGPFMMLTWWLDDKGVHRNLRWAGVALLAIVSIIFVTQSVQRVKVWCNDETLWTDENTQFPMRIPLSYDCLGKYYQHIGQPNKALANYAISASLDPNDLMPWSKRGTIFFEMHQFDSAIANYNRAIRLSSKEWSLLSNRGASKAQTGDLQGGLADLTLSLTGDSNNLNAWSNRALIYSILNQHENSIADYRKALQLNPRGIEFINAIAVEYERMNKFTESIAEYSNAIALAPGVGTYYLNRSYSWNSSGNRAKAIEDMQKAQSMGVKVPDQYLKVLMDN